MRKLLIAIVLITSTVFSAYSQSGLDSFIEDVKSNNKSLIAARDYTVYLKTAANTGLNPADPELSFKYMFDHSEGAGKMFEMELVQSFEFPTVYFDRNKRRDHSVELAEKNYRKFEWKVLIRAKNIYAELVYLNKLIKTFSEKSELARKSLEQFQRKFDLGEVSVFALNKARLLQRNAENELALTRIEREKVIADMELMSGGSNFDNSVMETEQFSLGDYEEAKKKYLSKHPEIISSGVNIKLKESEKSIANALSLPNFHIGIAREQEEENYMQGLHFGLSLPLYEHSNKGQEAENALSLSISENNELISTISTEFDKMYNTYMKLKSLIEETRNVLSLSNSMELLNKALELGEITITEFHYEMHEYYDTRKSLYELEKELDTIRAGLTVY